MLSLDKGVHDLEFVSIRKRNVNLFFSFFVEKGESLNSVFLLAAETEKEICHPN